MSNGFPCYVTLKDYLQNKIGVIKGSSMSLIHQFLGLFESLFRPYTYRIDQIVIEESASKLAVRFLVKLLLPGIGWVYLEDQNRIGNTLAFAKRFASEDVAKQEAQAAILFHRHLDQKYG